MPRRLYLAWRLYIGLNYSWRLAWHNAAYQQTYAMLLADLGLLGFMGRRRKQKRAA